MHTIKETLPPLLEANKTPHRVSGETILIPLPNNFGTLEVTSLDDHQDLIALVGEDWHLHTSDLAEDSPELSSAEKVVLFVEEILKGNFLLMEESSPGEDTIKWIEDDLQGYLQDLAPDAQYKVYNPAGS